MKTLSLTTDVATSLLRHSAALLGLVAGIAAMSASGGQLPPPGWAAKSARPVHAAKASQVAAAVVEYYHAGLDNYFITADPVEQAAVDAGAAGDWQRTGNSFLPGGTTPVCRFYGNANTNPATGAFYGPNSHFYTADPDECAALKALYDPNAKSWKFESNDFLTTPAVNHACPAGLTPVFRAYNNGFARGIDSNHRITSNQAAYQQQVAAGWIGEGMVMCAPPAPSLAGCGDADCPDGVALGSGQNLVNVVVEIVNTTAAPIPLLIPAGQTFIAGDTDTQNGIAMETLQGSVAPGTTGRFILHLFCINQSRHPSSGDSVYSQGGVTSNAQLLGLIALASDKLGSTLDPFGVKANATQLAVWVITDGPGQLTSAQRDILVALYATAPDALDAQFALYQQFEQSLGVGP